MNTYYICQPHLQRKNWEGIEERIRFPPFQVNKRPKHYHPKTRLTLPSISTVSRTLFLAGPLDYLCSFTPSVQKTKKTLRCPNQTEYKERKKKGGIRISKNIHLPSAVLCTLCTIQFQECLEQKWEQKKTSPPPSYSPPKDLFLLLLIWTK